MSSDSIVEQLTKYGEIDEQEAWNGFKQAYLLKTPEVSDNRLEGL